MVAGVAAGCRRRAERKVLEVNAEHWPIVIVESPYAGNVDRNQVYVCQACANCLGRQEVPYASHLFFPQFLDDLAPAEREMGMTAGYAFWRAASKIVFYTDRGWSGGMKRAFDRAYELDIPWETRSIKPELGK